MVDLTGPLHSLRDTLETLQTRCGGDLACTDRAVRLILRVNTILDQNERPDGGSDQLRALTEGLATLKPPYGTRLNEICEKIEQALSGL